MRISAGNASIEKFINFAKTFKKDDCQTDCINIMNNIVELGEQILSMENEFNESCDARELYEKIIIFDATIPKKGRNSHILINNMTNDTFMKFFKRHLVTKINLLKNNPTRLVQAVSNKFTTFVDKLLSILEKINYILPNYQNNENSKENNKIYYNFVYDDINKCFYEIMSNGIFIVKSEKFHEFAKKQDIFFKKISGDDK